MKIIQNVSELLGIIVYVIAILRLTFPFIKQWVEKFFNQANPNEQQLVSATIMLSIAYFLSIAIPCILMTSQLEANNSAILKYGFFFSLLALFFAILLCTLARFALLLFRGTIEEKYYIWAALVIAFTWTIASPFRSLLENLLPYPSIPGIH